MGLPFSSKLSCMLPAILGVLRGEIARGDDTVDQTVVEGLGSGQVIVALGVGLDLLDGLASDRIWLSSRRVFLISSATISISVC